MKKLINELLIGVSDCLLVILVVGVFAMLAIHLVEIFSGYHLTTPEIVITCGACGLLVGNFIFRFRKVKILDRNDTKEINNFDKNFNKDMDSLMERINEYEKSKDNSR